MTHISNYRDQLESYLKTLDIKADRVLDVGGAAKPVRDRVKSWKVGEYKILDNGLEKGEYDFSYDLNKFAIQKLSIGTFNIIFCLEVMEYIYDPFVAIKNISEVTKENGLLYISFPFVYPYHEPKESDFTRYTCDGAARLLGVNGLKIIETTTRKMTEAGNIAWRQFIQAEGMHAAKGVAHNQLGWIIKAQKV
jgi:SAM-dependent methyltransferase